MNEHYSFEHEYAGHVVAIGCRPLHTMQAPTKAVNT